MGIAEIKNQVEGWLQQYLKDKKDYNSKIYESMNYSLKVGGKRIRPILMVLTYNLYENNNEKILPIAGAMEMIHTYSLIHDDLPCMDDDDLRRGMPTNHKVFGEALAVLAGDALLNEAMNIMFNACIHRDINMITACKLISNSAGADGMIGGQVVDILSEGKEISNEELNYMHSKKTGALIEASILAGAIIGNASKEDQSILLDFGKKLGLAFQIKDDLLDVLGDAQTLGKNTKRDEAKNKTTYVTLYGIDHCKELCNSLTEECIELLSKINRDTSHLKAITLDLLKRNN